MAQLSVLEIRDVWISAGGNTGDQAINAVAVCLAESGGNPSAVSPSHDYGLWQINSIHASSFPKLWPQRFIPVPNAKMAIAISRNAMDWGPWCTAWADPANCGHYLGPVLQRGSPAASHLSYVAGVLKHPPPVEVFPPGFGGPLGSDAWGRIQHILGPGGRDWHDQVRHAISYMKGYAQ